ncbi:hypothetical protein Vadar_008289 [Vaccinium darrowii]|uniref:Uncharacterized protein n=1 Tax=Vaccinium darrowii TaxID=229202 RepID=A0ACB7YKE2_9ERIC|nr:hypothetical protein Vadar_008289 [Vaccinium darrowii]
MNRSRRPGVLMSVFTTVCVYGIIFPQPNFDKIPLISEWAKRCAREAIELYNNKHDAEFQFTRVVKLNSMGCAGYNFYFTFEAKSKDPAPMYFQALVYAVIPINETKVEFCRPQP